MVKTGDKLVEMYRKKYSKMSDSERRETLAKYDILNAESMDEDTLITTIVDKIRLGHRESNAKKVQESSARLNPPRHADGGFGIRDLNCTDHWRDLTENKAFRITKPTVICLPGNGSITTKQANGFCGMVERLMGMKTTDGQVSSSYKFVDLLGFYYSTDTEKDTAGTFNSKETEEFIDRLLLPLCVNDRGERLSLDEACKNCSLVTFFSHCYGASVVNYLITGLNTKLAKLGYSKKEISLITGHFMNVSYSPYNDNHVVPTVELFSQTDSFHKGSDKEFFDKYGYYLDGIMYELNKSTDMGNSKETLDKQKNKVCVHDYIKIITSRLLNTSENRDMSKLIDEHAVMYLKRDDQWNLNVDSIGAKNADLFSMITGYVLSWSVANSMDTVSTGKPHSKHNLDELCPILDDLLKIYEPDELKK